MSAKTGPSGGKWRTVWRRVKLFIYYYLTLVRHEMLTGDSRARVADRVPQGRDLGLNPSLNTRVNLTAGGEEFFIPDNSQPLRRSAPAHGHVGHRRL